MTKLFLIAASTALTVASGAAAAREPAATTTASVDQSGPARAGQTNQRYCVIDTVTGSHIARKKCLTRGEWLKEGFDPLVK